VHRHLVISMTTCGPDINDLWHYIHGCYPKFKELLTPQWRKWLQRTLHRQLYWIVFIFPPCGQTVCFQDQLKVFYYAPS